MKSAANGAANNKESKRSKAPPWPGIIAPASFTLAIRFSLDSIKSPKVPNVAAIIAKTITTLVGIPIGKKLATAQAVATHKSPPPRVPSHVFLGEMLEKGVLPIKDPMM